MKTILAVNGLPVRHKNEPCCVPAQSLHLSNGQTATSAELLKAVGDPTRLRMLELLVQLDAPLYVCDITAHFQQNQPTVSHHLRLLREAGLIDTEKRGIWSYYSATDAGRSTLSAVISLV
jgi:ArsR family transcriptional regulator